MSHFLPFHSSTICTVAASPYLHSWYHQWLPSQNQNQWILLALSYFIFIFTNPNYFSHNVTYSSSIVCFSGSLIDLFSFGHSYTGGPLISSLASSFPIIPWYYIFWVLNFSLHNNSQRHSSSTHSPYL